MIETADQQVVDWVSSVVGDVPVSLDAPVAAREGRGVGAYLLDLVEPLAGRNGARRAPDRVDLRYLVTAWAPEPAEAHRLLGALVFAARRAPGLEAELTPLPAAAWTAFGTVPRPCFLLRVPLHHEPPAMAAKPVLEPLDVRVVESGSLHGSVLGPGDVPLVGAAVRIPSHRLLTHTDAHGAFRFPAVARWPRPRQVVVEVKGATRAIDLPDELDTEPLTVRLRPPEE